MIYRIYLHGKIFGFSSTLWHVHIFYEENAP